MLNLLIFDIITELIPCPWANQSNTEAWFPKSKPHKEKSDQKPWLVRACCMVSDTVPCARPIFHWVLHLLICNKKPFTIIYLYSSGNFTSLGYHKSYKIYQNPPSSGHAPFPPRHPSAFCATPGRCYWPQPWGTKSAGPGEFRAPCLCRISEDFGRKWGDHSMFRLWLTTTYNWYCLGHLVDWFICEVVPSHGGTNTSRHGWPWLLKPMMSWGSTLRNLPYLVVSPGRGLKIHGEDMGKPC